MAEMTSQRNKVFMKMMSDAGSRMSDLVRWPESEATKAAADEAIRAFSKELRECGYPHGIIYLLTLQVASIAYHDAIPGNGDVKIQSLRAAWIKMADLLCRDK